MVWKEWMKLVSGVHSDKSQTNTQASKQAGNNNKEEIRTRDRL